MVGSERGIEGVEGGARPGRHRQLWGPAMPRWFSPTLAPVTADIFLHRRERREGEREERKYEKKKRKNVLPTHHF